MNEGAYELIKLLIQSVDQSIEIGFADGTQRTIKVDPEKLLVELDKAQNLEKEANWLADKLVHWDSIGHMSGNNFDKPEDWREAARKAVTGESNG